VLHPDAHQTPQDGSGLTITYRYPASSMLSSSIATPGKLSHLVPHDPHIRPIGSLPLWLNPGEIPDDSLGGTPGRAPRPPLERFDAEPDHPPKPGGLPPGAPRGSTLPQPRAAVRGLAAGRSGGAAETRGAARQRPGCGRGRRARPVGWRKAGYTSLLARSRWLRVDTAANILYNS
jgi:hypothetical protein